MKQLYTFLIIIFCCEFCIAQCPEPVNLTATNVTMTSATLAWTEPGTAVEWEVLVLPANSPPPTAASTGMFTAVNPFVVTGLSCGIYTFYVRSLCGTELSPWNGGSLQFGTPNCGGMMMTIMMCDANNDQTEMVDLTSIDAAIPDFLPPNDYTITHHFSIADAEAGSNPLPSMFAVPFSPVTIFSRAEETADPAAFTIFTSNIILEPTPSFTGIPSNQACDFTGSGFATFDLSVTSNFIYMNSGQTPDTWQITFHETATDAETGVNQIFNSYTNVTPNQQLLYVRIVNQTGCQSVESVLLETISCSGISLSAFVDLNGNTVKDPGEPNFPNGQFTYELNDDSIVHHVISPAGVFNILDENPANSYDLGYVLNPGLEAHYALITASYSGVSVEPGEVMVYYFPVSVTNPFNDLSVAVIPLQAPRPGFLYSNRVSYTNMGTSNASGTVTFIHDPEVTISTISQSGTTLTPNGFTYDFTNLQPFETRSITVVMQVPPIPVVNIGDMLTSTVNITLPAGDIDPMDNTSSVSQIIIGSYDPNDKMEAHGEQIVFSEFSSDDYLHYTIRFENTGTANAEFVRIEDILDTQLDENSVRMVSASHDYILERTGNNLIWKFDDIDLTYTANDPVASSGYVSFKVKPKPGYAIADVIQNTAQIYFDFNPAIITNTFESVFVSQLALNEYNSSDLTFYPNPANNEITVSLKNSADVISKITVLDVTGKIVLNQNGALSTERVDISAMANGMYLMEITAGNGKKIVKKLLVR